MRFNSFQLNAVSIKTLHNKNVLLLKKRAFSLIVNRLSLGESFTFNLKRIMLIHMRKLENINSYVSQLKGLMISLSQKARPNAVFLSWKLHVCRFFVYGANRCNCYANDLPGRSKSEWKNLANWLNATTDLKCTIWLFTLPFYKDL